MRRGEILGLKWADIDFGKVRITVRRALVCGIESTPKSKKGGTIASGRESEEAQVRKAAGQREISLERETGLEPATLSLGS